MHYSERINDDDEAIQRFQSVYVVWRVCIQRVKDSEKEREREFSVRPCKPSNSVCFMSFILLFNLLPTNDSQLWCHLYGYQTETYKIINGTIKVPERMQKHCQFERMEGKNCHFEYATFMMRKTFWTQFAYNFFSSLNLVIWAQVQAATTKKSTDFFSVLFCSV